MVYERSMRVVITQEVINLVCLILHNLIWHTGKFVLVKRCKGRLGDI